MSMMMMTMIAQMLSVGVKGGVCVWQSIIMSLHIHAVYAFSALTLLVGRWKGIRPVKNWVWGAVVVVCLELGADLHMAQLMSLPLTVSCFSKIQIGFTFLVPAQLGIPGKRPLNGCVRVRNRLSSVPNFTPPSLLPPQGQKSDKWKRWQMMISFTSILSSRSCKNSPSPGASTRDVELFAQTAARDKYSMRCPSTNSTLTNTHQLSSEIWRLQSLTATGHHERHVSGQSKWSNGWHTYQRQKQQQKSPTDAQKLQTWLNAADCLLTQSVATLQNKNNLTDAHRERKCADTIGTVLVPRAGHFQC